VGIVNKDIDDKFIDMEDVDEGIKPL